MNAFAMNEEADRALSSMPSGSPTAKRVVSHGISGAAVCFVGFWLADITGMVTPALWDAAADKWMLVAVACGYCSVGAALTRVIFLPSRD